MTAAEPSITIDPAAAPIALQDAVKPLKIALLGYRSAPFVGGQGIYIKYLSRALSALGHTVDVFSGPPYPELDDNVRLIKVPSLDLYAQPNHVTALRPRHLLSFTDFYEWWTMLTGGFGEPYTFGRRITKILADSDYDVIHDNQSLATGLLQLQAQGKTVVSTIHHPIHRDLEIALSEATKWGERLLIKRWYSFLKMQKKTARKLKNIVTVSAASHADITQYFERPQNSTAVIHNGIDTDIFCPQPHITPRPFSIITTASSDQPLKGLPYLLEALAKLKTRYPDVLLTIIGKAKEGGTTEKTIQQQGLSKHVHFKSGLSTAELVTAYAEASIMVCPSLYEGFGLPLGEAMACGRAAITTDGGALPEVAGDAAIVVPKGDAQALENAIESLFDDPQKLTTLGECARQHIVKNYSWHTVASELTRYYNSIAC